MKLTRAAFEKQLANLRCNDMQRWIAAAGSRAGVKCYLLVNYGQCDATAARELCVAYDLTVIRLFDNTPEEDLAEMGPHLIQVPVLSTHALLMDFASVCAVNDALTVLVSPQTIFQLASHLRSWFSGELEDGSSVLVRLFDPRICFDLLHALPPKERTAMLTPLQLWAGWGRVAMPIELIGGAEQAAPRRESSVRVATEWLERIASANLADLILGLIVEEDMEDGEFDHIAHPLRRHIVQRQLQQLEAFKLNEWGDQRFWSTVALQINPGIGDSAQGQQWLRQAAQTRQPLTTLLLAEPQDSWQAIQAQAPQALDHIARRFLESLGVQSTAMEPSL